MAPAADKLGEDSARHGGLVPTMPVRLNRLRLSERPRDITVDDGRTS
jgi:hypothetical protein